METHKVYIHRERGHVYIPFFSGMSSSEVFNLNVDGFYFVPSKQKDMGRFGYRVSISTATGETFAGINLNNGKVFFDTKSGLRKMLDSFLKSLRVINPEITSTAIEHSYVEVCSRFPWEKVQEAHELLEIISTKFRTKKTRTIKQGHDTLEYEWLFLVKNVLFGAYTVNIKVYLFFKYSGKKFNADLIQGFDYKKLPKVEVQVSDSKNIEIAKSEAVPIILAFLDALVCASSSMTEDDYELVMSLDKYGKGYQQIFPYIDRTRTAPECIIFHQVPRSRDERIVQYIFEKPRNFAEILGLFDVSENTLRSDLKRLEKDGLIYHRGRKGLEIIYAIVLRPLSYNRPLQSTPTKSVPLVMDKRT